MQGIEFEDDKTYGNLEAKTFNPQEKSGFIIKLLAKMGIEDRSTANFVLIVFAVFCFAYTIYLYAGLLGDGASRVLTQEQIAEQQKALREMQRQR